MSYYFTKTIYEQFDSVESKVIKLLEKEGFGVLTQIDMQKTLKKKLNVDFKAYKIFGACHPSSAFTAIEADDKIGLMLPCNITIQEHETNHIEVSAINPLVTMRVVNNSTLKKVAQEVSSKLKNVINNLNNEK